jgi:RimJ/RimL family protein N-acetyltransferase
MQNTLETARLFLRPFTTSDAAFILRLVNEPSWLEFIGDRNVHSIEDAGQYLLNGPIKSYAEHGYGFGLVSLKENNVAVGMCGLTKRNYLDAPDLGFAFFPEYTGQGYAVEIAKATIDYAKEILHLPMVYAFTAMDNIRSIQLLQKIGFTYDKPLWMEGEELNLYRIDLDVTPP